MAHQAFTLSFSPSFKKDFNRLPSDIQLIVMLEVKELVANPFGPYPKIKKLKNVSLGKWRLEVWPYRVRYDVNDRVVELYRVRHRKDIYRK